jgi:hypothetical protein
MSPSEFILGGGFLLGICFQDQAYPREPMGTERFAGRNFRDLADSPLK